LTAARAYGMVVAMSRAPKLSIFVIEAARFHSR
jgi:hypothetical protein